MVVICTSANVAVSKAQLEVQGFAVLPGMLGPAKLQSLRDAGTELGTSQAFGVRNPLSLSSVMREFAHSPAVVRTASGLLGGSAKCVRAIWFDKPPTANWFVPWHQDRTIAVEECSEVQGYRCWSKKEGVWHVQPPAEVLERMVTLRVHLDDANETNGALQVVEGSHRLGLLTAQSIAEFTSGSGQLVPVKAGDIVAMRPLILHSSKRSDGARPRRVLHLEFACHALDCGLKWHNPTKEMRV